MPHNGRGFMTAGLRAVLAKTFGPLCLHRVEANIQPGNERSRHLVQRLGFTLEGFSPRYLKIGGKWRDHERWAITVESWRASKPFVGQGSGIDGLRERVSRRAPVLNAGSAAEAVRRERDAR